MSRAYLRQCKPVTMSRSRAKTASVPPRRATAAVEREHLAGFLQWSLAWSTGERRACRPLTIAQGLVSSEARHHPASRGCTAPPGRGCEHDLWDARRGPGDCRRSRRPTPVPLPRNRDSRNHRFLLGSPPTARPAAEPQPDAHGESSGRATGALSGSFQQRPARGMPPGIPLIASPWRVIRCQPITLVRSKDEPISTD